MIGGDTHGAGVRMGNKKEEEGLTQRRELLNNSKARSWRLRTLSFFMVSYCIKQSIHQGLMKEDEL
jgi:hypothetical protein